jgi:hypothetical protein
MALTDMFLEVKLALPWQFLVLTYIESLWRLTALVALIPLTR